MMRFVLNTRFPETAASRVCIEHLGRILQKRNYPVSYNDWEHYERYDVAIFMSYDPDILRARAVNPKLLIGLGDPKPHQIKSDARLADFLLVSSVEQRDLFLQSNSNALIYYMFPEVTALQRTHAPKDGVVIAYHGNKAHLHSIHPRITGALEALGREMPVEFRAIYNIDQLGKWNLGTPDPKWVNVKHIQWSPDNYRSAFSDVDIGIVPNSSLSSHYQQRRWLPKPLFYAFGLTHEDYLIRYKFSSNPGRIYVFAQMGIPVVADFFPSAAQFLEHGKRGFLAHSAEGWYHALKDLALSPQLRQSCADRLRHHIDTLSSPDASVDMLLDFIQHPTDRAPITISQPPRSLLRYYFSAWPEYMLRGNRTISLLANAWKKLWRSKLHHSTQTDT